ncbi:MAG: endoribonuclease, partial [Deltaproteobacteria bacterium]|nr:endoribonuclease [Deltaproteobacteria bacterium]
MFRVSWLAAAIMINFFMHASAGAQTLEIKRYNYAEWTKGRFTEVVTVTGPGKMVFLAGVGAEDEDKPQGAIRHLGNPYLQCKYAYDKMKRHLAKHGGTLADVV